MKCLSSRFLDERKYFAYINFSRMVSLQKLNCLSSHSLSLSTQPQSLNRNQFPVGSIYESKQPLFIVRLLKFPFNIWDQRCIETNKCTDLYTILLNIFPLTLGSPPDPGNLRFFMSLTNCSVHVYWQRSGHPGARTRVFPALAIVKLLKTSLSKYFPSISYLATK